jgi:Zn-dependent M28 family amino/carboxypeptidase
MPAAKVNDLRVGALYGLGGGVAVLALLFGLAYWYSLYVPGHSHQGPLPPATPEELQLAASLRRHVTAIASEPHNVQHYQALQASAAYLEEALRASGYDVVSQSYEVDSRTVRNLEATVAPANAGTPEPSLVVGAHYDSAGDAPGANDNASGAAAILELARLLKGSAPARPIRLVLFVNEEPPYFQTPDMGSARYADWLVERGEDVHAMLSLETLGSYSDEPGSQAYPWPFRAFLGDRANFVAFVGMPGSRNLVHAAIGSFRQHGAFPSVGGVAPAAIPGIDWSDHWAFAWQDTPAIMITDTAIFRYPHYHKRSDTPDKLDYERLARVVKGLEHVVRDLAR